MTDNEIIKALGQCETQKYCSDCPYLERIGCKKHLYQDALDLINRQKAEIARLEEKRLEDDKLLNVRVAEAVNTVSNANQKYVNALEKEINRLRKDCKDIDEFARAICKKRTLQGKAVADLGDLQEYIKDQKAEAVKEFAERLKKKVDGAIDVNVFWLLGYLDYLTREMVGEDK